MTRYSVNVASCADSPRIRICVPTSLFESCPSALNAIALPAPCSKKLKTSLAMNIRPSQRGLIPRKTRSFPGGRHRSTRCARRRYSVAQVKIGATMMKVCERAYNNIESRLDGAVDIIRIEKPMVARTQVTKRGIV